jgi:hypothetical protein
VLQGKKKNEKDPDEDKCLLAGLSLLEGRKMSPAPTQQLRLCVVQMLGDYQSQRATWSCSRSGTGLGGVRGNWYDKKKSSTSATLEVLCWVDGGEALGGRWGTLLGGWGCQLDQLVPMGTGVGH